MIPVDITLIVGVDVGQSHHHAIGCDRTGAPILTQVVANTEAASRTGLASAGAADAVRLVVDQPARIGALPVAVAPAMGITVDYLPGLTMRQLAELLPGTAKTDARDAPVIAAAAWRMPATIRGIVPLAEHRAEVRLRRGFDADLAPQGTALQNRLRGLLTQRHPALERVLGPQLQAAGVRALRQRDPAPAALLADAIRDALAQQTVVVAGTGAADLIVPRLAAHLATILADRAAIGQASEPRVASHPLYPVLTSLPGVGLRTAATILVETDGKVFPSVAPLAAYAGVAPVTWQSGTSVRGTRRARRGNLRLQDAVLQSAFSSLSAPASRTSDDRKRARGASHTQALRALARRRTDVLSAMIRDGTPSHPPAP
ncbi:MAG: IS110 family transposase [Chloroflexota bacterium]|nr:IS110 family transposase [Chloroflexota bacterium]